MSFCQLKRLKALEREKDSMWIGLQVLDQARYWYQHRLKQISQRRARSATENQDTVFILFVLGMFCDSGFMTGG